MASKTNNKWEDYVAEIKPELYKKLNDYVAIDTLGNSKNSKAFRLRKNGESTNIFEKLNTSKYWTNCLKKIFRYPQMKIILYGRKKFKSDRRPNSRKQSYNCESFTSIEETENFSRSQKFCT